MMLTPWQGLLAAMADSDFSYPFYILSAFQLVLLGIGMSQSMRATLWYRFLIGMALLALPALLGAGYYFSVQPVA